MVVVVGAVPQLVDAARNNPTGAALPRAGPPDRAGQARRAGHVKPVPPEGQVALAPFALEKAQRNGVPGAEARFLVVRQRRGVFWNGKIVKKTMIS